MSSANSNEDEYLQKIKHTEENMISDTEMFHQIMNFWHRDVPPNFLNLVSKAKMQNSELLHEMTTQESLAKLLHQNRSDAAELDKTNAHLRDLERQEAALKEQVQGITHKIKKLKQIETENPESKTKKKLEMYRNFAKVSKKLTCTRFNYQGPNISGFIINETNLDVFNFNSAHISEQDAAIHLWKCLETVSAADWSDIFAADAVKSN